MTLKWQLRWHRLLCFLRIRRGVWWYATMDYAVVHPEWKCIVERKQP